MRNAIGRFCAPGAPQIASNGVLERCHFLLLFENKRLYGRERFAYGVIANLVAMPVVSVWVMPAGILGVMGMPLGFDGFWRRVMGHGIDWMISVAQWVTSFPGALGRVTAFGTGPF
jgi:competence protein ComEC